MRAQHPRSGLWLLLLHGLPGEPDRPWAAGEVFAEDSPGADAADAGELMAVCRAPQDLSARLGLIAVRRGADVVLATGWTGPANYFKSGLLSTSLAAGRTGFAACPDNEWQSAHAILPAYDESLIGMNNWTFWWD